MIVNLQTPKGTDPSAFVTKGRHRIKQYNDTVYLNNGDEFEIELFNPTSTKVLAKINLNGISLGSGIILRPGERVFLERYFDKAKKFLFETYEIDGNNTQALKAIQNNGEVSVEFYTEYVPFIWYNTGTYIYNPPFGGSLTPTYGGYNPITFTNVIGATTGTSSATSSFNCSSPLKEPSYGKDNSTLSMMSMCCDNLEFNDTIKTKGMETGRIEMGSNSNQAFTYDSTQFNPYYTWKSEWKILPLSQKPLVRADLKFYCGECGAKKKKHTFKFCPNCGTKY